MMVMPVATSDTHTQRIVLHRNPRERRSNHQRGANRLFGVHLMRLWPADMDQHAVTDVAGGEAAELSTMSLHVQLVRADDLVQVLGIELRRHFESRPDRRIPRTVDHAPVQVPAPRQVRLAAPERARPHNAKRARIASSTGAGDQLRRYQDP